MKGFLRAVLVILTALCALGFYQVAHNEDWNWFAVLLCAGSGGYFLARYGQRYWL